MSAIDYTVIADPQVFLTVGGDPDSQKSFSLPSDVNRTAPSILALMVDTDNAKNLQLNITLNGQNLLTTAQYNGEVFHTINEVVDANRLVPGSNTIIFKLVAGTGTLRYSDVVLWWRHN